MAGLVTPTLRYQASYVDAAREFIAEGNERFAGTTLVGTPPDFADQVYTVEMLTDPRAFERFVARNLELADPVTPLPENYVPATVLWWVEHDEFLGRVSIRHELTPFLRRLGGHIGYAVRPSARRQGHATAMLRASLACAHGLGIDPALVTCDDVNVGSRKVIEANSGVPDEPNGHKLRFWISTS